MIFKETLSPVMSSSEVGAGLQRSLIWMASVPAHQQVYVVFRKRFDLAEPPQAATLHLFADSRYLLWVNGQYVQRGPRRFDPTAPEYDTCDLQPYLHGGANVIAVLVHHYTDKPSRPEQFSGRIMRHAPGFAARLDLTDSHEAGATPAYQLSAQVLGVRLDGPVWNKRLLIEPHLGNLTRAAGTVVTEHGLVPVSWRRADNGLGLEFRLEIPPGVTATVAIPKVSDQATLLLNGQPLTAAQVTTRGRRLVFQLTPGMHTGRSK